MTRYLIIASIFLLWNTPLKAQIWPGDITDNGEVNAVDILYWAIANGNAGPERSEPSLLWNPQIPGSNWSQEFEDGQNFAYADCNGDGTIDLVDLFVIQLNQDSAHTPYLGEDFSTGTIGEDPQIWLGNAPNEDSIEVVLGNEVNLPIHLGSSNMPAIDFTGLAFQVFIDTNVVGIINPIISQDSEDWLAEESAIISLNVDEQFQTEGALGLDVAWYLLNQENPVSGSGNIGDIKFIIEEDLTLFQEDTTITVVIKPVRFIDDELNTLDITGDSIDIIIYQDSTYMLLSSEEPIQLENTPEINVFPNPVSEILEIELENGIIEDVQLFNAFNQEVAISITQHSLNNKTIDVSQLPDGTYWIRIKTRNEEIVQSKFIKINSN